MQRISTPPQPSHIRDTFPTLCDEDDVFQEEVAGEGKSEGLPEDGQSGDTGTKNCRQRVLDRSHDIKGEAAAPFQPDAKSDSEASDVEVRDEETGCSGGCCDVSCVKANQPTSIKALAVSRRPGKGKGQHFWSVSPSCFGKYPWLSMCERTGLLFCFYCPTAQNKQILTVSTKADLYFTRVGFSNWKKALHCFSKHESSHSHFEAVYEGKDTTKYRCNA